MKIFLNEEEKNLDIIKRGDTYIYYLDGDEIGGYNPIATKDKIIFEREIEKKLGDEVISQIKDQLNSLSDEEIETEALDSIKKKRKNIRTKKEMTKKKKRLEKKKRR